MDRKRCLEICKGDLPPFNPLLKALWLDYNNKWNEAHQLADSLKTKDAAWIHAYLHRKEGDLWNAGYWYRRAGKEVPSYSIQSEWENLVMAFCDDD